MELFEVMRTTFAARDYTGEELSDEELYHILDNARFAPSGGNRQGNRVIIVRDQATRETLSELAVPAAKRYAAQVNAVKIPGTPSSQPAPAPRRSRRRRHRRC